jgi:ATP-dependent DNA ligase
MLLELARDHRIEGIVGNRLDSTYRPGRSPA